MRSIMRLRPSPSMVVALIALFISLAGVTWAGVTVEKNSVTSTQVANNSLKSKDLKDKKGVKGVDVVDESLTGADVNESMLAEVPSAANAGMLDNLDSPAFLRSDAKAADADKLDGVDSGGFLSSTAAASGDLTGNYPNPSIAANAVNAAKVADSSLNTLDIENLEGRDYVDAFRADGVDFAGFLYASPNATTEETTILDLGGLQLKASCPSDNLVVKADTSAENQLLNSVSVDALSPDDTDNKVTLYNLNGGFDSTTEPNLVADDQNNQLGHTEYALGGVSVVWQAQENEPGLKCLFSGHAMW